MPQQPGAMRNRWTAYAGVSAALAVGVIVKSLAQRPNFYSAAVYLSQSNANLMILCNLVFVTACSVILFLQRMLYGPLRPIEIEQLYEKAWFAVTETCLAMTIFRGEIGAWFLVMFFSLLAGKVWGWIGEGRVEVLEQQQHNILGGGNARLFHTRLAASLALSVVFDLTMLEYVVGQVLHMARPDMMVMFGFEFAVLSVASLSTAMRYGLNLVEIGIVRKQKEQRIDAIRKGRVDAAVQQIREQQAANDSETATASPTDSAELTQRIAEATQNAAAQPVDEAEVEVEGWEGKGRWTFYLDLATDFFKLVIYLSFFFILLIFYGLPLHIMRDVFLTCRSFFKRISDFMRYRTATRDMNERYPDATEAEIGREDVCIICREDMRPYVPPAPGQPRDPLVERMRPKKLPCGHVLHFSCLRSWLERQQICPTCRATVVPRPQGRSSAAAAQGAAPAHPANRGNARPRVFQLGPLRIGVGAARGNNMLEELEQQLANINQPDQGGENLPQQYGFGIRWGGMRRRPHTHRRSGTVEDQLNSAERQIQREVDALQASMGELQALRNVQAQLARIRMARQGTPGTATPVAGAPAGNPMPTITTVNSLSQDQNHPVLQAGSDRLPPGLTLPDGWTMMPLQPMHGHQAQPPSIIPQFANGPFRVPQPSTEVPQPPAINVAANPATPLPIDIQALIQQAQDTARNAAAQLEAFNNQHQPATPQPQQTSQNSPQPPTSIPASANAVGDNRMSTSSTTNGTPRRAVSATAGSTSVTASPLVRPIPQPASAQPRPTNPPQERAAPQSEAQRRVQPPLPVRIAPTNGSQSRTTVASATIQPPKLSPATSNGSRTISPHRPTRSIGSSWGFSGVEKDEDDEEDDDDDDDDDDDKDKDEDKDEEKDDDTDSDDDSENGKRVVNSSATSVNRESVKGKGKTPTVEDLVEDPD